MDNPFYEPKQPLAGRLYRTPYLVLPRLALEAMPLAWQEAFEALLAECDRAGMETPDYHVLRADAGYTSVTLDDPDDLTSWPRDFYILQHDEWANYRHGNIVDVCPSFKATA